MYSNALTQEESVEFKKQNYLIHKYIYDLILNITFRFNVVATGLLFLIFPETTINPRIQ